MTTNRITPPTGRTPRTAQQRRAHYELLRHRAVKHDGEKRDEAFAKAKAQANPRAKSRKQSRIGLTPDQVRVYPLLALHLAAHEGWPPKVTRNSAPRIARLKCLRQARGPLALLTLKLPMLDLLPLKSAALAAQVKQRANEALEALAPAAPYDAAIQRGGWWGCTHTHLVLPLSCLQDHADRAALLAAPSGPRGGCALRADIHGVIIADGDDHLERVGSYLSRDPDCRLDDPSTSQYLDALEDELRRKRHGGDVVRLSWHATPSVDNLLYKGLTPMSSIPAGLFRVTAK